MTNDEKLIREISLKLKDVFDNEADTFEKLAKDDALRSLIGSSKDFEDHKASALAYYKRSQTC